MLGCITVIDAGAVSCIRAYWASRRSWLSVGLGQSTLVSSTGKGTSKPRFSGLCLQLHYNLGKPSPLSLDMEGPNILSSIWASFCDSSLKGCSSLWMEEIIARLWSMRGKSMGRWSFPELVSLNLERIVSMEEALLSGDH